MLSIKSVARPAWSPPLLRGGVEVVLAFIRTSRGGGLDTDATGRHWH
jgi:hypothetical protein